MTTKFTTRLGCEALETRETPAVYGQNVSVMPVDNRLQISPLVASGVSVRVVANYAGDLRVEEKVNGQWKALSEVFSGMQQILFAGSDGDDFMENTTGVYMSASGGRGNDTLIGGRGTDFLDGGRDNDTLKGMGGTDTLIGGEDNDTLWGGEGSDFLHGMGGNDKLYGEGGEDFVSDMYEWEGNHGSGTNYLSGGTGRDTVIGGYGDDYLSGGQDGLRDVLTGNFGADTFERESVGPTAVVNGFLLASPWAVNLDAPTDLNLNPYDGDKEVSPFVGLIPLNL